MSKNCDTQTINLSASADSQKDNDQDSGSEAGSPAKSGSPEDFDELNSQTQRVLRGIVSIYDGMQRTASGAHRSLAVAAACRQCNERRSWSGTSDSEAAAQRHTQQDSEQKGCSCGTVSCLIIAAAAQLSVSLHMSCRCNEGPCRTGNVDCNNAAAVMQCLTVWLAHVM